MPNDRIGTDHRARISPGWRQIEESDYEHFYARTFPDSAVGAVHRAPSDFPGGKAGDVLTVEFTVCGVPCFGLNGGDAFKHSEAFTVVTYADGSIAHTYSWGNDANSKGYNIDQILT